MMNVQKNNKIEDLEILKFYHLIQSGGQNSLELIKIYIKDKKIDVNNNDNFWTSPLSFSIFMKEEEIALYLIEIGSNVRFIDSLGLTPLNYAVTWINYEKSGFEKRADKEIAKVVISLVNKGANLVYLNPINNMYPYREALLHKYDISHKIIMNRIKAILLYPNKYPDQIVEINEWMLNKSNVDESTEISDNLIDACYHKNEEVAFKILENNPEAIHSLDDLNQNALHYAISNKQYPLIKKLILMGVDYHKKSIVNLTPLEVINTLSSDDQCDMFIFLNTIIKNKDKLIKEEIEQKELNKKNNKSLIKKNKENIKKHKKNNLKKELLELENMSQEDPYLLKKNNFFNNFFFEAELNNNLWNE
jgi:ankyrin repeat protein